MKLAVLCLVVIIAAVSAENCQQGSDCMLEDCGSSGIVACVSGVCTCNAPGGTCSANNDCFHDHSLHCPAHDKVCNSGACECRPHGHGGGH